MTTNDDDDLNGGTMRRIHLTQGSGKMRVGPPEHEKPPGFKPFALPLVTVAEQAMVLAELFYQQHRRCLGLLLLLDIRKREWHLHIPTQQASPDSSCWTVPRHQPGSRYRLAGSFQTRILCDGEDPAYCVPRLEGVHLIMQIAPKDRPLHAFLRMREYLYPSPAERLIHSQLIEALRGSLDRIQLL